MASADLLSELEGKIGSSLADVTRADWLGAADLILSEADACHLQPAGEVGLRICQKLHNQARSMDALPIALAVYQRAMDCEDLSLAQRAALAAGLLSSDTADFAGAIEFQCKALEIAKERHDNAGASRAWNNIGSAFCGVGRYELANASFNEALAQVETESGPQFSRFSSLTNLAQCALHLGAFSRGIESATLALAEMSRGALTFQVDPFSEVLLRRNMVRLYIASGSIVLAQNQIQSTKRLAELDGGVRAGIAAATAQAAIDIACGRQDIAATRLDKCLAASRPIRPALRDTLTCMVKADEMSGNPERALLRLGELRELLHDASTAAAQGHLALSEWRNAIHAFPPGAGLAEVHSRLTRKRGAASVPAAWSTLTRLALGNSLQIDPSAAHGVRVGALSRLLAQVCGVGPVQALEIGLAAQIHDVGLAADHENIIGRQSEDGAAAEEDPGHCEAGWRILCDDDHPRILLAREIAKFHHAWWNGEGFPEGISGRSIPIHARICAVADAYDNIMHARVGMGAGRNADTIASGLARLKSYAGTRLEPELVERFSDSLEDETRNEGIELESGHGLAAFHQLINSLSDARRYI